MTAIERLREVLGNDGYLVDEDWGTVGPALAAVEALYQAAKRIVNCSVYELEEARQALEAEVRRVEVAQ